MKSYLSALFDLFYPRLCVVCGKSLMKGENLLCSGCLYHFPYSYGEHAELELMFREVCDIQTVYSLFRYNRESRYRHPIYALKYHNRRDIGVFMGKMLGEKIGADKKIDGMIPLPLHPQRERQRGYNQARQIALGIAGALGIPIWDGVIFRKTNNPSQTGLTPEQRVMNVERIFTLGETETLSGCHVLVVDDVITTGSTLSSCLCLLNEIPELRVSVACLARTD